MPHAPARSALLPRLDGRALDFMKIAAAACMLADHIDLMWFSRGAPLLGLIGRVTLPVFCYAAAVGVKRAEEKPGEAGFLRYLSGLLLLALASEPVSILTRPGASANIVFTLALGVLFAHASRRMKDWQVFACMVAALASMPLPQTLEYGFTGVMLPAAMLRVMEGEKKYLPFLLGLLLLLNLNGSGVADASRLAVAGARLAIGAVTIFMPYMLVRLAAGLPRDGRWLPRYFLHAFYPGHLLALWILKLAFFS